MICPQCHGRGSILLVIERFGNHETVEILRCPYVGCVNGWVHCCDGIREQPDGNRDRVGQSETKNVPTQMLPKTDV